MSRKRIVVMGFMASIPIAGVVWQHIHYIVGLLRLGHDVYYIEDSKRLPYQPVTFDTSIDYSYAATRSTRSPGALGFTKNGGSARASSKASRRRACLSSGCAN